MLWWVELGYPDEFDEDDSGHPMTGQVIKYYREQKKNKEGYKMSQQDLAKRLGVNRRTVIRMELNQESVSKERRELLCAFLGIPPIMMGLVPISKINQLLKEKWKQPTLHTGYTANNGNIDLNEHKDFLAKAKGLQRSSSAVGILGIVESRSNTLYSSLAQSNSKMQAEIHRLLWDYHIFLAQTRQRQGQWDSAIGQIDKALLFANSLKDDELCAVCFLRSGIVHHFAGRIQEAANAFDGASMYDKTIPQYLVGIRTLYASRTYASLDFKKALSMVEHGGNMVRSLPNSNYAHGFDFSIQAYHLNRGEVLIGGGRPHDALNELSFIQSNPVSWWRARQVILESQAYAKSGNVPMAVSYAEAGLDLIKTFGSDEFHQIRGIHNQLTQNPLYANHKDTKHLGYMLSAK